MPRNALTALSLAVVLGLAYMPPAQAAACEVSLTQSSYTVDEGAGELTVTASIPADCSIGSKSIDYRTFDGTADGTNPDRDYVETSGTLTFPAVIVAQRRTRSFTVTIEDDEEIEESQTFTVDLEQTSSSQLDLGSPGFAPVTITDNDLTVELDTSIETVAENDNTVGLIVSLSGTPPGDDEITVDLDTIAETATEGVDYEGESSTLSFTPDTDGRWTDGLVDRRRKTILLEVLDDSEAESTETFEVVLSNPSGQGLVLGNPSEATVEIENDDTNMQFSQDTYEVGENAGNALITVTRTGVLSGTSTVTYATTGGDATSGGDYEPQSGAVTFSGTDTTETFTVTITNDFEGEGDENIVLQLTNPNGGTLGTPNQATLVIDDDEVITHDRSVSLNLKKHLKAKGTVTTDGPTDCVDNVKVKIQRKKSSGWDTIKKATTDADGDYKKSIPDKADKYRAKVKSFELASEDKCGSDTSPKKTHRH